MQRRGHNFKLVAVAALVVLALTGFSTSSHSSSGGSSGKSGSKSGSRTSKSRGSRGGGGGGCSSSKQDHDSSHRSHYDYDDDDDYGTGSNGSSGDYEETATPTPSPTNMYEAVVTLVSCASKKTPYATVQLHNPNDTAGSFELMVSFLDRKGKAIDTEKDTVDVPAGETVTVKEYVGASPSKVARCKVPELATPVGA
ncbi:hypothetical protein [Streptomyces sp. NPDC057386]|jgi:hypothetical protein|uniref:Secreted protein n=1 Tax=Streptomyces thermocoprophilus TaxID=78356 RepID=A0ABV5VCN7_9ACTN